MDAHDGVADVFFVPLASYDWVFSTAYYKCPITQRKVYLRNDFTGVYSLYPNSNITVNPTTGNIEIQTNLEIPPTNLYIGAKTDLGPQTIYFPISLEVVDCTKREVKILDSSLQIEI